MAVVAKKRKSSTTFYVATSFAKRLHWERSGTDRREAERLDARRKREVKDGTFSPVEVVRQATVADYATHWGTARKNASAGDDRRNLARFAALPEFGSLHLDDVRPRHIIGALERLKLLGTLKLKTLQNAYGTLRTMFRDARIAERMGNDPCVLPRNYFSDDQAVEREPYTRTEATLLLKHNAIPEPIRMLNALCLFGGLREGEACGRRWKDIDEGPRPLLALEVASQYGGRALKTKKARVVPIHPELGALLIGWARTGFGLLMGRPPTGDDYIVPYLTSRSRAGHHTRSTYYKAFVAGCAAAGVPNKSLHSMRHTMITLARRGGADKDVLAKVTHNAKGDIVDRYTHRDWSELCLPVLALGSLLDARPSLPPSSGFPAENHALPAPAENTEEYGNMTLDKLEPCSIPGASTQKHRENRTRVKERAKEDFDRSGSIRAPDAGDFEPTLGGSEPQHSAPVWGLALAAERVLLLNARHSVSSRPVRVTTGQHRSRKGVA